jgi:hypothetical protein
MTLVSNVGTEKPKVKELKNPVDLWKKGVIEAQPVQIKL